MSRIVCQFSCGAASAVAAKLILAQYDESQVVIVNAYIEEEHKDNRRFLSDCEVWFDQKITVLSDETYGASTNQVWERKRYIKGQLGAPCSKILKRDLLNAWSRLDDTYVLGFTVEEQDRLDKFLDANNGRKVLCPLIDQGLTKEDCLALVQRAGIELPAMYGLGYDNANCIGCPKGGQAYWQNIRSNFPEQFVKISSIQKRIGPGASFLRFRSGPRKNERMSLEELPPGCGNMKDEPSFSCGFSCEMAEDFINPNGDL